jgi:hypothetical protein
MILPELTSPVTRTVLPSNDALYGATHVELDLLGPMVVSVPANVDDRYFSVSVMDAHMNNVAHIGPRWTGNDAVDVLVVPPDWAGVGPDGMRVITSPTPSICMYNRMLVRFDDGDLDRVRHWQAGLRLTQLSHWRRRLDASGGAVYDLSFGPGETPSVEPSGYWSVTLYDEHSFLVDNPIDRHATRPDRPGLVTDPDGRLTFVLATELPAGVPEANRLPAPGHPAALNRGRGRHHHGRAQVSDLGARDFVGAPVVQFRTLLYL